MQELDAVILNFNESNVAILNVTLAFIMFGIALELKLENFKILFRQPKSVVAGLLAQLLLLPVVTLLLIFIFNPQASIALGMILVAACPGGNISNFICSIAKGNTELSIVLTIITSIGAIFFTPFNFAFYGNLYGPTSEILKEISLNWFDVMQTISLIIIIPITVGMICKRKFPKFSIAISSKLKVISMILFLIIVAAALGANYANFIATIGSIATLVILHNAIAILTGYSTARVFKLPLNQQKTIAIETGIQNSGLGLLLIFSYFEGLGGMAIIAAAWGIWHIISGFGLAFLLSKKAV